MHGSWAVAHVCREHRVRCWDPRSSQGPPMLPPHMRHLPMTLCSLFLLSSLRKGSISALKPCFYPLAPTCIGFSPPPHHPQIEGLPTVVFIPKDGSKPALRTEGLLPAEQIIEIVNEQLS